MRQIATTLQQRINEALAGKTKQYSMKDLTKLVFDLPNPGEEYGHMIWDNTLGITIDHSCWNLDPTIFKMWYGGNRVPSCMEITKSSRREGCFDVKTVNLKDDKLMGRDHPDGRVAGQSQWNLNPEEMNEIIARLSGHNVYIEPNCYVSNTLKGLPVRVTKKSTEVGEQHPLEVHLHGLFELDIGSKGHGAEWLTFDTQEARDRNFLKNAVVAHVLGHHVDYKWTPNGHNKPGELDWNIAESLVNRAENIGTDPEYGTSYSECRKHYLKGYAQVIGSILTFMEKPDIEKSKELHEYFSRLKTVKDFLKIGNPQLLIILLSG